jgi:hypothetical protein
LEKIKFQYSDNNIAMLSNTISKDELMIDLKVLIRRYTETSFNVFALLKTNIESSKYNKLENYFSATLNELRKLLNESMESSKIIPLETKINRLVKEIVLQSILASVKFEIINEMKLAVVDLVNFLKQLKK